MTDFNSANSMVLYSWIVHIFHCVYKDVKIYGSVSAIIFIYIMYLCKGIINLVTIYC